MAYVADALVLLGLLITTLGVVGLFRMPDIYTQLHAAGKAAFLGMIAFLLASLVASGGSTTTRIVLIAGFLALTTPVAAHVLARAAFVRGEGMASADAVDESGAGLRRRPLSDESLPEGD